MIDFGCQPFSWFHFWDSPVRVSKQLGGSMFSPKSYESFMLRFTGRIIMYASFFGVVVTLMIDEIRQRPFELSWLQGLGIVMFAVGMFFGASVQEFLGTVRALLDEKTLLED